MDDENELLIEEDYYASLNVPRNASPEEINNAYRRFSRLYHPDKHVDPEQKKKAEILFSRTKKAYEVLNDPHQRAIYDSLGTRGLKTEGWEIVQRTKTPQEIREEYERLAREREERRLQQRTNPKGSVTVNINATDCFNRYDDEFEYEEERGWFPHVEVSGMSFQQSIEAPVTLRDTITLSGHLSTQNGTGQGSINVSCRRLLSERGWLEADVGIGGGPSLSLRTFRTLTKRVFCNGSAAFQFTPHGARPGLILTLAMQLDRHTVGYVTWRAGLHSSMSTSLVRDTPQSHTTLTLQFGIPHSFLGASYSHKIESRELRLRAAAKAGTFGALLEIGAEKSVSKHSSVAAAVAVGVPIGVTLKDEFTFRLSRGSQVYSFPIHLCEEILPSPIFYATIAPLITWALVKKLIVDPIARETAQREKEKQREANKARIAEKRREAEAAVELMRATYSRIYSEETARKGLVISDALYGHLLPHSPSEYSDRGDGQRDAEVITVTIPLQCLVKDSKLILHESSKSQLPGFYDPCIGEDKSLRVQYFYNEMLHEITVNDTEALRIPKHTHRINPT